MDRSLVGYSPGDAKELDTAKPLSTHSLSFKAEGAGPGGGQLGGRAAGLRGSAPVPAQGKRVSLRSPSGARGPTRAGTRDVCGCSWGS